MAAAAAELHETPVVMQESTSFPPNVWHPEELIRQPQGYYLVPIKRIPIPKWAIREELGPLKTLMASIRRRGVLQPLCLRPIDPRWREFEPIIGLRRYFACRGLEESHVPAYIRSNVGEDGVAAIALEENRYRKNLTHSEVYRAIRTLRDKGYIIKQISEIAGKSTTCVIAYLKIPKLPKKVREAFFLNEISLSELVIMVGLDNKKMLELLERKRRENLGYSAIKRVIELDKKGTPRDINFLFKRGAKKLLGTKLVFNGGGGGVSLEIKARNKEELLQTLHGLPKFLRPLDSFREYQLKKKREYNRTWKKEHPNYMHDWLRKHPDCRNYRRIRNR